MKFFNFIFILFVFFSNLQIVSADTIDKGSSIEAKLLLERAVNLIESNEVVGLTMITIQNGGFHNKDLYPFCFNYDGILMAHPYNLGVSIKNFKSDDGVQIGKQMLNKAEEDKILEISYILPIYKNGKLTEQKAKKTAFYTKTGKYVCASGYYK